MASGGIDWNQVAGGSGGGGSSGGVDWGSLGTLPRAPSGGSGTSGDATTGPAQNIHAGGGGSGGGIFGAIEGLAHGAADFGVNMARGLYATGDAAFHDVENHPASLLAGAAAPLAANALSFAEGGHGGQLTTKIAEPIGHAYEQKYGAIFEHPLEAKSWETVGHNIAKDPFGSAMDALTLATIPFTGGESAVLRGATLGEKIGAVGDLSRLQEIAQLPKAERAAALADAGKSDLLSRAYVAATANRLPITRAAMLGDRLKGGTISPTTYTIDAAKTPWGRLIQSGYHSLLERPGIASTPFGAGRFVAREARQAVETAQYPRELALRAYRDAAPASRAAHIAQQIAAEAPRGIAREDWLQHRIDFYKNQLDQGVSEADRLSIQAKLNQLGANSERRFNRIQKLLTHPSPSFLRFYQRGRELSTATSDALGTSMEGRLIRAERPGQVMAGTQRFDYETRQFLPTGASNLADYKAATEPLEENPFGANYAYSHLGGTRTTLGNRAVISRTNMPLGDTVRKPDVAHLNTMLRLTTGRYFTNPDVLSRAGIQAFRWATAHDFRTWLMQHARDVPEEGRIPPGWRAVIDHPPREVKEAQGILENGAPSAGEQRDLLSQYWGRVLPKGAHVDGAHLMVPEQLARAVEREFQGNSLIGRMVDSANNAWRYAVLRTRPAWALRNIVSQHFLYYLNNLSPAGIIHMAMAMKPTWGEKATQTFITRYLHLPSVRSAFGKELEDAGVAGVHTGTASIMQSPTRYGQIGERLSNFAENRPIMGRIPAYAKKLLSAPADFNTTLNQKLADDLPRMAQYRRGLLRSPARARAQTRMLQLAKETDQGVTLMRRLIGPASKDVFREASPEELQQIARQGQRVLGNWASLAPWERRYVRRVIPFYQFFKTMTGIITHLGVDHPERIMLLNNLVKAAQQDPSILPAGAMPSWLQGAIALGPAQDGVQPLLDMQTANHFNAPLQFAQGLAGFAGLGGRTTDATGLMGPLPDMLDYAQGINPTTGTAYKGTGAHQAGLVRALIAELTGLPQVSLAQQYLAGDQIPGMNARIHAQYPSTIYANTPYDNLLNYLLGPYKRVRLPVAAADAAKGR